MKTTLPRAAWRCFWGVLARFESMAGLSALIGIFLFGSLSLLAQVARADGEPSCSQKVLLIGDSHSTQPFGDRLEARLRESYSCVSRVAASGAQATNYLGQPDEKGNCYRSDYPVVWKGYDGKDIEHQAHTAPCLDTVLKDKPTKIIIALGTNEMFLGRNSRQMESYIQKIQKHLDSLAPDAECVWIAPPDVTANKTEAEKRENRKNGYIEGFTRNLETMIGDRCRIFKSVNVTTHKPKVFIEDGKQRTDTLHYWDLPAADDWADRAYDCIIAKRFDSNCVQAHASPKPSDGSPQSR